MAGLVGEKTVSVSRVSSLIELQWNAIWAHIKPIMPALLFKKGTNRPWWLTPMDASQDRETSRVVCTVQYCICTETGCSSKGHIPGQQIAIPHKQTNKQVRYFIVGWSPTRFSTFSFFFHSNQPEPLTNGIKIFSILVKFSLYNWGYLIWYERCGPCCFTSKYTIYVKSDTVCVYNNLYS